MLTRAFSFFPREREREREAGIAIMRKKWPLFAGRRRLERIRRNGDPSTKDAVPCASRVM